MRLLPQTVRGVLGTSHQGDPLYVVSFHECQHQVKLWYKESLCIYNNSCGEKSVNPSLQLIRLCNLMNTLMNLRFINFLANSDALQNLDPLDHTFFSYFQESWDIAASSLMYTLTSARDTSKYFIVPLEIRWGNSLHINCKLKIVQ